MRWWVAAVCAVTAASCRCAVPGDDVLYRCDGDGGCSAGFECLDSLCYPAGFDSGCERKPDEPDDEALDTNCDGFDGVVDGGVFVDPINGTTSGRGTPASPLSSLSGGIFAARARGVPAVYLAGGPLLESETVVLTGNGPSLYGGYSRLGDGGWVRVFPAGCDGGLPTLYGATTAMRVERLNAPVTIEHLCIRSATAASGASVALVVMDTPSPRLRYLDVQAGDGAPGISGVPGGTGPSGASGAPGADAISPATTARPGAAGGDGGCLGSDGFSGGDGADLTGASTAGNGPLGGRGASNSVNNACPVTSCTCATEVVSGADGGAGLDGLDGPAGAPGDPSGIVTRDAGWAALRGGQGRNGDAGTPGSGGGGAGAYRLRPSLDGGLHLSGASGGGGGAAGCPGTGGQGGLGGGASIGLLVFGARPTLEGDLIIGSGRGGNGGDGGPGGRGGSGGLGGPGGHGFSEWCDGGSLSPVANGGLLLSGPRNSNGGNGGKGGEGGTGGPGGPGSGGPSVAIWCAGSSSLIRAPSSRLIATYGVAGQGGSGLAADAGIRLPQYGCP